MVFRQGALENMERSKYMTDNPLSGDLDYILSKTSDLWEELRDQNIFITGGTGFFGCWLLESFIWANDNLDLKAKVVVLTRNPDKFKEKVPQLAFNHAITLHKGDILDFQFPAGKFPFIIHAATEASASLNEKLPLQMFDTVVSGTRRCLDFARQAGARKFLLTSSGAVYGRQPPDLLHIPEEYNGAPDTMDSKWIYGESKRTAEILCATYSKHFGIEAKIARCWAFVGPYLPLDIHFAIGNFIRDALDEGPIRVNGDGTPFRSYQYAADLTIWLWTILFNAPSCRPYNVGSDQEISISECARLVASESGSGDITIARKPDLNAPPERYVPSTHRAQNELGLSNGVPLEQAIAKTISWHKTKGS
jgi:nucleoside-diphosphate-sugar epimerase